MSLRAVPVGPDRAARWSAPRQGLPALRSPNFNDVLPQVAQQLVPRYEVLGALPRSWPDAGQVTLRDQPPDVARMPTESLGDLQHGQERRPDGRKIIKPGGRRHEDEPAPLSGPLARVWR